MFNNIVYFIIVLLIFHIDIDYPSDPPETSLSYTLGMAFLGWLAFAVYCRRGVQRLIARVKKDDKNENCSVKWLSKRKTKFYYTIC